MDRHGFNNIEIIGSAIIEESEIFKVKANYYVKDEIETFYFTDFQVLTNLLKNENYALKNSNINIDTEWGQCIKIRLGKDEEKLYRKEFKEFHKQKLKQDEEYLKDF